MIWHTKYGRAGFHNASDRSNLGNSIGTNLSDVYLLFKLGYK
ncbi:hypothetical protein [Aerosakkonema funiforme]|nr:hypothetical protein [Aerosakkonema funiforme]